MTKIKFLSLKATSIFLILILFITCNSKERKLNNAMTPSNDSIDNLNYNGIAIDSSTVVISQKGDSIKLLDISSRERVLFVRYSNYACKDCIKYVIGEINKLNINPNVCLLISDIPIMDLHVIKSVEHLKDVYRLDSINTDFDYGLTPYVFQINHKGEIKNFYIPNRIKEEEFQQYLINHLYIHGKKK